MENFPNVIEGTSCFYQLLQSFCIEWTADLADGAVAQLLVAGGLVF